MSTMRATLAALLFVPLAIAGCKINTINSFSPKAAHVRVVNVVADVPVLDVSANDEPTFPGVAFQGSTDYNDLDNESTTFAAKPPAASAPLAQATFALAGEQTYTLVVHGTSSQPLIMLLPDATIQPGGGRSQIRIANAATGIGPVDVYVTAPGAPIADALPNLVSIGYTGASTYLQVSPGTYQMRITEAATKTVLYDSPSISLSDNTSTDLILYTTTSGRLPNALLLDVNGAGQRVVANNTLANVKFVHAAPQAGAVNVLVDATTVFSNVPYPQANGYSTITAGSHTVSFEPTAAPGAPIATVAPTLAPATDTTVVATGLAGSTHAFVVSDNNLPPTSSANVRVRLVNASIDVGPLDLLLNDAKQASAVPADAASGYAEIAGGTYTIKLVDPGTTNVRAMLSDAALVNGTTNSIYAIGQPGALVAAVSQDD
jgi:hypothetical protein